MTSTFSTKEWNALPTATVLAWVNDPTIQIGRKGAFFTVTFN